MMKKISLILILLVSFSSFAQSKKTQKTKEKNNFLDNVRFGGGFGLGFGNTTNISVSPMAIYDFNEKFSLGLGVGYQYYKRNSVVANVYSTKVLSLYNPIKEIQISAEYEHLFVNQRIGRTKDKINFPALYLGAAYRISRNFTLGLRYDILHNKNKTIYASAITPIIRVFF